MLKLTRSTPWALTIAGLIALAGACGDNTTVETDNDLPLCDSKKLGAVYYVKGTSKVKVCTASGWSELGATGPTGGTGSVGATGGTGSSTTISSEQNCTGNYGTGLAYSYNVVAFNTGDKHVDCSINMNGKQMSSSIFYNSVDTNVGTARCRIYWDVEEINGLSGYWQFTYSSTSGGAIDYVDSGGQYDGVSFTITCTSR